MSQNNSQQEETPDTVFPVCLLGDGLDKGWLSHLITPADGGAGYGPGFRNVRCGRKPTPRYQIEKPARTGFFMFELSNTIESQKCRAPDFLDYGHNVYGNGLVIVYTISAP